MEVVIVQNCIEREGLVFIKKDAKVGVGVEGAELPPRTLHVWRKRRGAKDLL